MAVQFAVSNTTLELTAERLIRNRDVLDGHAYRGAVAIGLTTVVRSDWNRVAADRKPRSGGCRTYSSDGQKTRLSADGAHMTKKFSLIGKEMHAPTKLGVQARP